MFFTHNTPVKTYKIPMQPFSYVIRILVLSLWNNGINRR